MADDSSELDELVQVPSWHSATTNNTGSGPSTGFLSSDTKTTAGTQNKTNSSTSSSGTNNNQTLDDSNTNGFTTAPATSDDDFDSEDDDDSRSMCSNKNTSNSGNAATPGARCSKYSAGGRYAIKGEQKRSHHNVLERKRRDLLKDSFAALRESVPMNHSKERVSRAEILKQAADFIQSTVKRNAVVRAELEDLIRKNREFDEKKQKSGAAGSGAPASDIPIASSSKAEVGQVLGGAAELPIKQEL